jgi:hypothetical protein
MFSFMHACRDTYIHTYIHTYININIMNTITHRIPGFPSHLECAHPVMLGQLQQECPVDVGANICIKPDEMTSKTCMSYLA